LRSHLTGFPEYLRARLAGIADAVVFAARPDLIAADYRLQSALKSQQAQYRSWYPSITLNAALSTASEHSKNLFNVPILGGSVSLNLPFLNWRTMHWKDRSAEADFENAKLAFEKALTTALNEVDTNYRQYRTSRQTLENQRRRHRLDVENSRYYRVRYQHGRNELKDWLSALFKCSIPIERWFTG